MKISSKVFWLFLFAVTLIAILLPRPILAQKEEAGLTLWLRDEWYRSEARAGKDNHFFLEVKNTGNRPITNIRLSSEKPEGWTIEFSPAEINYLSAGSLQTVDVNIKPVGKAPKAEYKVTLIAEATEIRRVQSIWVTVKPASFWIWILAILGALVVAGFVFLFVRLNRQKSDEPGSTP